MRPVRLVVARCEVSYSGRLNAFLPESTRLLILKSDGSVLVHADAGGYKPLNWMTPPTTIEAEGDPLESIVVRKRAGKTEDRLEIRIHELLSDVSHEMGEAAALEKDGVEHHLQAELAAAPETLGEGLRLVRREWPTDIGPVDLMCRDADDALARRRDQAGCDDRRGRAALALPGAHPPRPGDVGVRRRPRGPAVQAAGGHPRRGTRDPVRRGRSRGAARGAGARAHPVRATLTAHAPGRIRTCDPRIRSPPLCPLSYRRSLRPHGSTR